MPSEKDPLPVIWKCAFEFANDNALYLSVVFGDEVPIAQFLVGMFEAIDGISENLKDFVFDVV